MRVEENRVEWKGGILQEQGLGKNEIKLYLNNDFFFYVFTVIHCQIIS